MKISKIEISNVIGIARADLVLKESVLVVAADNAQGKSSIADAISMAFTGKPTRVDAKKDLGQLLHQDAAKGRVSIEFGGADEGADFRLPKGEQSCSEMQGQAFIPYVLNSALFSHIEADARRSTLFDLTGCKASGKVVKEKLEARDIAPELIEDILPLMRGGFPAAEKECRTRATQAKGAWRQITGGNWGAVVAEDWKAPAPEGPLPTAEELNELLAKANKVQADLSQGIAFVGEQTAKLAATAAYVKRRQDMRDVAELLDRRKTKLAVTEKDHAEWVAKLKPLEARLAELKTASMPVKCPCCEAELRIVDGALEKFAGLKENTKEKTDVALEVTKARKAVEDLTRVKVNDMRDVAESEAAVKQLKVIEAEEIDMVDEARLEASQDSVNKLRQREAQIRAEFNAKQQLRTDADQVQALTKKAAAAHEDVKAWLKIADALAPDGIPAELLASAIEPFNQSLELLAGIAKWQKVVVRDDMVITYGGRIYGLCSESERWRADCLLALAIAQISELRLVVLDRFDVLDMNARKQLLMMLRQLGKLGAMDTQIMCGTMKEAMNPVAGIDSVWLQNGIAELNQ